MKYSPLTDLFQYLNVTNTHTHTENTFKIKTKVLDTTNGWQILNIHINFDWNLYMLSTQNRADLINRAQFHFKLK